MDPMNIYLFTNFSNVVCGNRPILGAGQGTPTKSIEIVGPRDLGHAHFQGICAHLQHSQFKAAYQIRSL